METLRFFLIDFENVKRAGLVGLDNCDEFDKIIIFYSDACDTITFEIHQQLMKTQAIIEYQHIKAGGKNSLDHQLSSYLGYLICENPLCEFYIVSRDRGFEFITDFWTSKSKMIDQVLNLNFEKTITVEPVVNTITIVKPKVETTIKLLEAKPQPPQLPQPQQPPQPKINNIPPEEIKEALKLFPQFQEQMVKIIHENNSKAKVNAGLNKLVPDDQRGAVAQAIRPLIKHYTS